MGTKGEFERIAIGATIIIQLFRPSCAEIIEMESPERAVMTVLVF